MKQGQLHYSYIGDKYVSNFDGTSAATPHVAGVAALVLSANPNLSGRKVKEIIERTCTKVRQDIYDYDSIAPHGAWDYQMGYGLVNAYQAVLMAQGCKDYPYCTIDTIRGNVTWSNPITVGETLVIDSLATLTVTDTVAFYSTARIIVRPGGALIVNGGTLTNACDGEMWEGIIVEGDANQRQYTSKQGRVILTNATIENAHTAISTHTANDSIWVGGGIVQATNTLFRNNRCSAEFLEYENHTSGNVASDNISHFTRCTFTINDDNLLAANGTCFEEHVSLYKVRGVKFNGCAFRNEVTTATTDSARGRAIYSEGAGYYAKRVCPVLSHSDPCGCFASGSDTVTRCSFEGFFEAVSAANTYGNYYITIDNCDFSRNNGGVRLAAADNVRVSFCNFNLSDSASYYGAGFSNSTGYTVESNTFHRDVYTGNTNLRGIVIFSSGSSNNVIRKNNFNTIDIGCLASGVNAGETEGLHFQCNNYTGCGYDIGVLIGLIRSQQGSSTAGADNNFTGTQSSSIALSYANSIAYYYSNSASHTPTNPSSGVTSHNDADVNSCLSSICWEPQPIELLSQYQGMAEELLTLSDAIANRGDDPQDAETDTLKMELSDLSAAMGDLSRAAIHAILSDTVVDMELLKEWYRTIAGTSHEMSLQQGQYTDIPVAAYQLAEVYSTEGNYAAAAALLQSLPQQFNPDEAARHEYENYMNLQRLRESVAGRDTSHNVPTANWYRMAGAEIADMQQVAEYDNGRAARMAKEILCFFHHICYEDEPLLPEWDGGADGRGLHRDAMNRVSTNATGLRIHPNPANTTLTVETDSPVREIAVYDMAGHAVMVETCHGASLQQIINIASLHSGIYLLRVETDSGVETGRFVKN